MTPVEFIRKTVLKLTQSQLAEALDTTQASVSRWETAGRFPTDIQPKVRELARGGMWSDTWFFDVPTDAETANG
jgi:transcriptional regulator with XRE-family HTH domain